MLSLSGASLLNSHPPAGQALTRHTVTTGEATLQSQPPPCIQTLFVELQSYVSPTCEHLPLSLSCNYFDLGSKSVLRSRFKMSHTNPQVRLLVSDSNHPPLAASDLELRFHRSALPHLESWIFIFRVSPFALPLRQSLTLRPAPTCSMSNKHFLDLDAPGQLSSTTLDCVV
jgi:hypothetical protein